MAESKWTAMTVRYPADVYARARVIADSMGVSMASVMRSLLYAWVVETENKARKDDVDGV